MHGQSVIAVYETLSQAKAAVEELRHSGLPTGQISFIGRTSNGISELKTHANVDDRTQADAAIGAGVGGLLGLLAGTAFFFVPAIGPLLLLGPMAGGLTGAVVGGVVGAMAGWGVPKDEATRLEAHIRAGKYLVAAHGDPEQLVRAEQVLKDTAPDEIETYFEMREIRELKHQTESTET